MRLFHAHRHVVHGAALHRVDGQLRVAAQGVDVGNRHIVGNIEVAFFDHQAQGLRLLEVAQHHAAHFRLAAPVVRIALHAQHIFCLPGFQRERPGTGFMGGQPAVALHRFAVQHPEVAQRRQRVDNQLRVVIFRQHDLHREAVRRADLAVDIFLTKAVRLPHRGLREVEMQNTPHRPHHVGGGQRVAGVKLHVVAQMKGQGFTVRADVPGFRQRGPDVGELLRIKLHQRVVEVNHDPHHFVPGHRRRVKGEQVIHIHADDELIRRRFRQRRPAPHRHGERE